MANNLDVTVQYTRKFNNKVKRICSPLFSHLGFNAFLYHYISNDGHATSFGSDIPTFEYYYYNNLYLVNPFVRHPSYFQTSIQLVSDVNDAAYQETIKCQSDAYDIAYRVIFFEKLEHGCQGFSFATPKNFTGYVTDLKLLSRFIEYFKEEAKEVFNVVLDDQRRIDNLLGPRFYTKPESENERKTKSKLEFLKKIGVIESVDEIRLTARETDCMQLLLKGCSASDIANALHLSKRTVESYLEQIKLRSNCDSKMELITKFREIDNLGLLIKACSS